MVPGAPDLEAAAAAAGNAEVAVPAHCSQLEQQADASCKAASLKSDEPTGVQQNGVMQVDWEDEDVPAPRHAPVPFGPRYAPLWPLPPAFWLDFVAMLALGAVMGVIGW